MALKENLRKISSVFTAGAVGALFNSFFVWALGYAGITQMLEVQIVPDLTAQWLYPRIVWGGLWGMMFLLPAFQWDRRRKKLRYFVRDTENPSPDWMPIPNGLSTVFISGIKKY